MTTIATNNSAVTLAIHRAGRCLHLKSPQTLYTAQFNRKLQPFYAKQTQFPKPEMDLTPYCKTAYGGFRVCSPRQNKPNFNPPIEDRSLSRLVGAALLFRAFSFSCFEFISDLDIRILCFNPTIMQNKPNFQKPEINLTPYCKTAYGDFRVCSPRKNKPNQTQYCSALEIRPRRIHAAPPANLRHRRNKINQTCFRFFETPQKLQKIASLSHIFAGFRAFPTLFTANQRVCVDFLLENPP